MNSGKTLIVCQSVHHGNTMKVAKVMADELDADIRKPSEVSRDDFDRYDLIGFGSGIYNQKHHRSLFELADSIGQQKNKKAFIFSTASICSKKMHEQLRMALSAKGFDIIDEFICRGFMSHSFTKIFFGGINKKRPNRDDLEKARKFAVRIRDSI